jgi:hypothetical protein
MVDDLSEPEINQDFVRPHLSVESQNLLANCDYDDDDPNHSSSVDMFTMDDPDAGSESGVDDAITNEVLPGYVPPSTTVPLTHPASLHDLTYQPDSTDAFVANQTIPLLVQRRCPLSWR